MSAGMLAKTEPHDLVQEVLKRSLQTLDLLERGESPQIMGLFRLLIRDVVTDRARYLGARKRADHADRSIDLEQPGTQPHARDPTPSAVLFRAEQRQILLRAERTLSEEHRRVLELRWGRGLSLAQVGAELGITADAASKLEARARQKLQRALESEGGSGTAAIL
jgi:RNA polymerase sigma factor (sigma-70 family)